jgi:hypothetical protein
MSEVVKYEKKQKHPECKRCGYLSQTGHLLYGGGGKCDLRKCVTLNKVFKIK